MNDASRVLQGRYALRRQIGFGGMGAVYAAHDRIMDREVAIKELREEYARDEMLRKRFIREAQVAGSLSHPNVVTVHDLVVEERTLYIVMEFLEGGTLLDRMARAPERRMDPERVLAVGVAALRGLEAAHDEGLVHRDIKPGNLLFDAQGVVKIADFGVVTARRDRLGEATSLTQDGTHPGTLVYMAPEQIDGASVDGRSDVYSLAAVLYEAIAGVRYFERPGIRRTERALMDAICDLPPVPLRAHVPYVAESVWEALEWALAKDIERRPRARELADALEGLLARPRSRPSIEAPGTPPPPTSAERGALPTRPASRRLAPVPSPEETVPAARAPGGGVSPGTGGSSTRAGPRRAAGPATPPIRPRLAPATAGAASSGRFAPRTLVQRPRDGAYGLHLPAVTFVMGSEEASDERPPRRVYVSEFVLDRDPVTVGQYRLFLEELAAGFSPELPLLAELYPRGKDHRPEGWGTPAFARVCPSDEHPVVFVDWFDALAYAAWAGARLPTEAEWERAARGSRDVRRSPWGDEPPTPERAVFGRRGEGPEPIGGRPAGSSPDGLRDMVGNVWEWCLDRYDPDAYPRLGDRDPILEVEEPSARAVKRGASWTNAPTSLRCSKRGCEKLHARRPNLGFRCAWNP
ncbi:MAG: hypothetical protein D6731_21500 [Planctomycetota bacterium]|nr:MAG: hypothetical protein D6731_21500 [Planctomycetota bacterium]